MKKIYYYIAFGVAAATLYACGGKDDPAPTPNPNPNQPDGAVEVTISTTDIQTKAAVLEFKSGAEMNIFAKTYGRIDAPNIVDGVKASFDGAKWAMSPRVLIDQNQKNAFVYAVSPYDASYTDAAKIPVIVSKQIDLMYSGAYVPASLTSPGIKLTMKHALSLLSFNIIPVNYNGGQLKYIKIGGEHFYTTGTMDASTGKIANGETGELKVTFNKSLGSNGWNNDLPGIWSLPFNTKAGAIDVEIAIDSKVFNLTMPEVEMKQGFQYIFRLALTNNGLEFDPSKTETISLNVTEDGNHDFAGYGCLKIKADGSSMIAPEFTGDAVFGTISTPAKNTPYSPSASVDGIKAGETVIVETWNSTGFSISSLEGIETIDLSQYE